MKSISVWVWLLAVYCLVFAISQDYSPFGSQMYKSLQELGI